MPRCLTCARIVDRENARCDICTGAGAVPGVDPPGAAASAEELPDISSPAPAPSAAAPEGPASPPVGPEPAPASAPSPPPSPPTAWGWSHWHVAAGASAVAAAAAVTVALLRGGSGAAADPSPPPELDQASFGPAIVREAPTLAPGAPVKWTTDNREKWVSNHKRSVAFELPAENTASSWLTRVRPILVVRCLSNTTDAFVYTQVPPVIEPGDDTRTVRLQFDEEDEYTTRWAGAADHDALFAPDPISFARRLAHAQTLRFGFTPHNGPPATIVFDVRGFETRVGSIARTCRWK